MTYNIFLVDSPDPGVMAQALAAILQVPVKEIDVADADGDPDERHWEALVSCEYSYVQGNLSYSAEIYAQDSVPHQPPEAQLSAALAERIGTPVLYPPTEAPESAHWLVTPEGLTTRARLDESEDEDPSYTVTAVEAFVRQLPDVPVRHLPEVVREQKVVTPLTDAFAECVASLPEAERSEISPDAAEATRVVTSYLGAWEKLSRRAENGWEPSGWFPLEFYRETLGYRDDIEGYLRQLPGKLQALYRNYLDKVDDLYRELTVEDNDHVVANDKGVPVTHLAQKPWWWYRRPEPMPWSE
ncbi:hypothetical protein [Streptomyces chrestomyceticus]|uniref:Uncharacterized protein n=1 Tax=Streptomyces chrestomyceticus TaxID=68185 RepID=A0ABU7X5H4_9ACTN